MVWVKEKMQQARLYRIQARHQEQFDAPGRPQENIKPLVINQSHQSDNFDKKLVWLATGLVSGAIIVSIVWWATLNELGAGAGNDRWQSKVSGQAQERLKHESGHPSTDGKSERRNDAVQTSTVSGLEDLPAPTAGVISRTTLARGDTTNVRTAHRHDLQTKVMQPTADTKLKSKETDRGSGIWSINLASLQQKVDAERFVKMTHSKGVIAEINQVTVKGMQYWRVQVTGFSSSNDARAKAGEIQEKLGLKDVWIVKRD